MTGKHLGAEAVLMAVKRYLWSTPYGKGYMSQPTSTPPSTMIKKVLRKKSTRSFGLVRQRNAKNREIRKACQKRRIE
jgi:hypothetical protein